MYIYVLIVVLVLAYTPVQILSYILVYHLLANQLLTNLTLLARLMLMIPARISAPVRLVAMQIILDAMKQDIASMNRAVIHRQGVHLAQIHWIGAGRHIQQQ